MNDERRLELLRLDLNRLQAIRPEEFEFDVPACAGWDVAALLRHAGQSLRLAITYTQTPPGEQPDLPLPDDPGDDELLPWLADLGDQLLALLAPRNLDTACASWAGDQSRRWWLRRMGLEVAVHRWDAQSATRRPDAIEADLADDGIDEFLDVFLPLVAASLPREGSIHLHGTDPGSGGSFGDGGSEPTPGGEWFVEFGPAGVTWSRSHAKGDVAVRAPVEDLYLVLWGRVPPSRLERLGDLDLLDRLLECARF